MHFLGDRISLPVSHLELEIKYSRNNMHEPDVHVRQPGSLVSDTVSHIAQKLLLCKADGWGLECKMLFCAKQQKPECSALLVPNAQKSWSGILFPFPWHTSSSWLKKHEFRKKGGNCGFFFFSLQLLKAECYRAFITNKRARLIFVLKRKLRFSKVISLWIWHCNIMTVRRQS